VPRQAGAVVLDIGGDTGALVIHASGALLGLQIEVARRDGVGKRVHVDVLERAAGDPLLSRPCSLRSPRVITRYGTTGNNRPAL
jgi:hypothetical protein